MQTQYVDKCEAELRKAIETADYIASIDYYKIPGWRYIGVGEGIYGKCHYYCDDNEGKYYYETFFAREMRIKIRNQRFQNLRKK